MVSEGEGWEVDLGHATESWWVFVWTAGAAAEECDVSAVADPCVLTARPDVADAYADCVTVTPGLAAWTVIGETVVAVTVVAASADETADVMAASADAVTLVHADVVTLVSADAVRLVSADVIVSADATVASADGVAVSADAESVAAVAFLALVSSVAHVAAVAVRTVMLEVMEPSSFSASAVKQMPQAWSQMLGNWCALAGEWSYLPSWLLSHQFPSCQDHGLAVWAGTISFLIQLLQSRVSAHLHHCFWVTTPPPRPQNLLLDFSVGIWAGAGQWVRNCWSDRADFGCHFVEACLQNIHILAFQRDYPIFFLF